RKYSRDRSALCIGFLFRAREIADPIMRQEIISHLKSLLSDSDDWMKEVSKTALQSLAKNDVNHNQILKNLDLNAIAKNLQKELKGSEQEKQDIMQMQEFDCVLLYSILHGREDIQLRRDLINFGIVDALLHIFASRDLNEITQPYTQAFFVFTHPSNFTLYQLLIEKSPFFSLLRLFDHKDEDIISDIISSIDSILYAGAIGTELTSQHPYYTDLATAGGIEKVYSLFKQSTVEFHKIVSAICLGMVFRAQEIKDSDMKEEIITYLKCIVDSNDDIKTQNEIKLAIKCLAQNQVNRVEIENDGFTIPK
ncbi:MAG: hypothetical protein EZS28_032027, partial [Streblomastix strix]